MLSILPYPVKRNTLYTTSGKHLFSPSTAQYFSMCWLVGGWRSGYLMTITQGGCRRSVKSCSRKGFPVIQTALLKAQKRTTRIVPCIDEVSTVRPSISSSRVVPQSAMGTIMAQLSMKGYICAGYRFSAYQSSP